MLSKSTIRQATGFTLIELMIGIAIMSIVLALGMPSYKAWIQNAKIRSAAESIVYGLQIARSEAVSRNALVQFTLNVGSSWTVCVVANVAANAPCVTTIQTRAAGDGSSSAITVAAADGPTFRFDNLGRMTLPALVAPTTTTSINVDVSPAILSAAESRDLRVTVDVGGRIRMCDPNVALVVPPDSRACNS